MQIFVIWREMWILNYLVNYLSFFNRYQIHGTNISVVNIPTHFCRSCILLRFMWVGGVKPEIPQQPSHWLPNQLLPPTPVSVCHKGKNIFKLNVIFGPVLEFLENSRRDQRRFQRNPGAQWVKATFALSDQSNPGGNAGLLHIFRHHSRCQICHNFSCSFFS